jgi:protoporphyrinogen oxidase
MRIAIIGAGFTGLSAAFYLSKSGHEVTVFEKNSHAGGLATGFTQPKWKWSLEEYYHHWFTNDKSISNLAKEIDCEIITRRPKTSIYLKGKIYQLDSPINVLTFPKLSIPERLRMAIVLGIIRYTPFWKMLEGIRAEFFLRTFMGKNAYETIWKPQLENKFGEYAKDISLAWFWARLTKRTSFLSYPRGGFQEFTDALVEKTKAYGGKFIFDTEVTQLKQDVNTLNIQTLDKNNQASNEAFDKVLVTLPSFSFLKITHQLPNSYKDKLKNLKEIAAINLVLRFKEQFLKDGTYWLSICDEKSPLVAIVEHTNYMDKENYNNEHIVYLGEYLPTDHSYMKMKADELLEIYDPYLKKINPSYRSSLISYHLFKNPFAQPIIPTNYSKIIPHFKTPLKGVYLANMQQVYPWDRGTNYATEAGEKVAKFLLRDN